MQSKEERQEIQYVFPYHHLTYEKNRAFFLFRHLFWGIEHFSYIGVVKSKVMETAPPSLTDVGCGEGRIISDLEQTDLVTTYTGTDISKRAIQFARAFCSKSDFFVHDIIEQPLQETTDMIISCEVIEHIQPEQVNIYIDNIWKSLKPGGKILITTPTTNVPTIPKHYQHFNAEKFDSLLGEKFESIEYTYLNVVNKLTWILNRLISNRLFMSNSTTLNRLVFSAYKKHLLYGTAKTGSRILVTATKKAS